MENTHPHLTIFRDQLLWLKVDHFYLKRAVSQALAQQIVLGKHRFVTKFRNFGGSWWHFLTTDKSVGLRLGSSAKQTRSGSLVGKSKVDYCHWWEITVLIINLKHILAYFVENNRETGMITLIVRSSKSTLGTSNRGHSPEWKLGKKSVNRHIWIFRLK